MFLFKSIISLVLLLCPLIFIPIELYYYRNDIDYKIVSLTTTNLFSLIPVSISLYYTITNKRNMILEFIPFYCIIFTSSMYHLCQYVDNSVYCILHYNILYYIMLYHIIVNYIILYYSIAIRITLY